MKVGVHAAVAITLEHVGDGPDLRYELPVARPAFGLDAVGGLRDARELAPTVRRGCGAARHGSSHTPQLKSGANLPFLGTRSLAPADRPFARGTLWQRATPPLRRPRHGRRLSISQPFELKRSHRSCSAPNLACARRRGRSLQHGARRPRFRIRAAIVFRLGPFYFRSRTPVELFRVSLSPQGAHAIKGAS